LSQSLRPSRPVVLVSLATAFSLLGDQTLYSVLPTYYTSLNLLPYQVGLILSVNRWIRLVTNQLAERFCRKYSLTLLLTLALILGAVTTATYGTAPAFSVLLIARIAWGLSWSFIRQAGLMTVVETTAEGAIGRMVGYYNGISRLGSVGGNMLGAVGHDLFGFTATLLVFGAVSLLGVPLGVASRSHAPGKAVPEAITRPTIGGYWKLIGCGFVVGSVGAGLMMSTLGSILKSTVGDSVVIAGAAIGVATLNGALLTARWVTDGLTAPMLGALSDRIGRRRSALLFFGTGAVAMAGAAATTGPLAMVLLVLIFFACGVGATVTMIAEAGTRGSKGVAAYVTASDTGSAVGPMLGWMTLQYQMPTSFIFVMGAGLYLIGTVLSQRLLRGPVEKTASQ
jgi:MFS family permease